MVFRTKTYAFVVSALPKSISDKRAAKKRKSLNKIVFLDVGTTFHHTFPSSELQCFPVAIPEICALTQGSDHWQFIHSPKHKDCSGLQSRKTRLQWWMWPSSPNASEGTSEQALGCSLERQSMKFLKLASVAIPELAALDLNMIAVALTPSWLVWILTVMPLWLYFALFQFCPVLLLNSNFIYYTSVSCVSVLILYVSLLSLSISEQASRLASTDEPNKGL